MPTRTHRILALIGAALLAAPISACTPDNPAVDSRAATQGLPNLRVSTSAREWLLDPVGTTVGLGSEPITLDFHADNTASGLAPCNTYRAAVAFGYGTVEFTDITTSLRACGPEVMQNETAFFAALTNVRDVDLTNRDRLILTAPGGVRLAFNAFGAYDAIVGTWTVASFAIVDGLVSPPAGIGPVITFTDDRTVTVDAGCGPTAGTWALDDDRLTVTDLSPNPTCAGDGDASIEAAVITALSGTHSVQISPTKLTLLTPAGTVALIATAPR